MFRSMYTSGAWTDILLGKLPPFPPTDSVVRWSFQPIPVKLTPPAGLAVDNAVVQFGYAENGDPGKFYCSSRQEKCLATAATVPAVPFVFPSEGIGGWKPELRGVPCAERMYRRNPGGIAANAVLPGEVSRCVEQDGCNGSDRNDRGALSGTGPP